MTNERFRSSDYRDPLRGVPLRFVEDLKRERDGQLKSCLYVNEPAALYRALGASAILDEIVNLLENGVPAPAPDAGISGAT